MTQALKMLKQIERLNALTDREWAGLPAWDAMTQQQKAAAVTVAGIQGQRMAALRTKYELGTL